MLGIKNSRQPQVDCEHDSPAYRGRSAARWVPVGDGLTHKLTDRRSLAIELSVIARWRIVWQPADRMGRDPIGACCTHGPSQSCPPTRASLRAATPRRHPMTNRMTSPPDARKVIRRRRYA